MTGSRLKDLDRICLFILAAVTLSGFLWIAINAAGKHRQLQREQHLKSQAMEKLVEADRTKKALETALTKVKHNLEALNSRIPVKTDMGALLKELHRRMKQRQITMLSLQPGPAVAEQLFRKTPVRLVFQGAFLQSYLFISDLETLDQLVVPEKMTIIGMKAPRECQVDLTVSVVEKKNTGSGG